MTYMTKKTNKNEIYNWFDRYKNKQPTKDRETQNSKEENTKDSGGPPSTTDPSDTSQKAVFV